MTLGSENGDQHAERDGQEHSQENSHAGEGEASDSGSIAMQLWQTEEGSWICARHGLI